MMNEQAFEKLYHQYQYAIPDFSFFMELLAGKKTKQECVGVLQRVVIALIQEGKKELRKPFVEQNLGLIVTTAKKLMEQRSLGEGNSVELGDLCQEGYLVFDQCLDRYDVERDTMFSTYVVASMQYRMQTYMRQQMNPLYVSEYQYEKGLLESQPYSYVSLDATIQETQSGRMEELVVADNRMEMIMESIDVWRTIKQVLTLLPKTEREFFIWHYVCNLPSGQFQYQHHFTSNKVAKMKKTVQHKVITNPGMQQLRKDYFTETAFVEPKVKTK